MSQLPPKIYINCLENKVDYMYDQIQKQNLQIEEKSQENIQLIKEIQNLKQNNQDLDKQIKELKKENTILKAGIKLFQNKFEDSKQKLNEYESINILLNGEIERMLKENQQLKNRLNPPIGKIEKSEQYTKQLQDTLYQSQIWSQSQNYKKVTESSRQYFQVIPPNNLQQRQEIKQKLPNQKMKPCRIFQSFQIIGCKKEEIQINKEYNGIKPCKLYEYSSDQNDLPDNVIQENVFPFGNLIQTLDDFEDVKEIIYAGNEAKLKYYLQIFIVPTNQEQQVEYLNEDLVRLYNPDKRLYGMSITVDDFTQIEGNFIKFQKSYIFFTYFPIVEIFSDILCHFLSIIFYILDQIKFKRNQILSEQNAEKLMELDGYAIIQCFKQEFEESLQSLLNNKIQKEKTTIDICVNSNISQNPFLSYMIPQLQLITNTMLKWSSQIVFKLFNAEQIQQIYLYLSLERNILFISENQQKLSATMQYLSIYIFRLFFLDLLSPMKWEHNLIFSINEANLNQFKSNKIDNEQSYIIGLNKNIKDSTELLRNINKECENIILIHIDKFEDKIQCTKQVDFDIVQKLLPKIKELEKFRQNFTVNWQKHRFLQNPEKQVIETLELFKLGIDEFLFKKIRSKIEKIKSTQQSKYFINLSQSTYKYDDNLVYNYLEKEIELSDRQYFRYFLSSNNFKAYIQQK